MLLLTSRHLIHMQVSALRNCIMMYSNVTIGLHLELLCVFYKHRLQHTDMLVVQRELNLLEKLNYVDYRHVKHTTMRYTNINNIHGVNMTASTDMAIELEEHVLMFLLYYCTYSWRLIPHCRCAQQ
jgi:hypothetical protein